jgi:O-antigen ligase
LLTLLLLLMAAGAYLTENRMVWPAAAVSAVVLGALCLGQPWLHAGDRRRIVAFGAAAFITGTGLFVAAALNKAHFAAPGASTAGEVLSSDRRVRLWEDYAVLAAEAPWLGHGFGRGILSKRLQGDLGTDMLWHGHDLFLDALLELGIAGLIALVLLLGATAARYASYVRTRQAPLAALGAVGLAFLAGFVVKNLTDDFFDRHIALLYWSINGALLGWGERLRRGR